MEIYRSNLKQKKHKVIYMMENVRNMELCLCITKRLMIQPTGGDIGSSWERASYIHSRGRRETCILIPPFGCIINLPTDMHNFCGNSA